ncbi:hypothetical protein T06_7407 [Trichinella sp. T6]|nr:hypothetical protein T06_7407 [Trichinella sp. T6]
MLVCFTCVASNSIVKRQTLALTDRGPHEADRGRHEADRGPHEADRGPHEADRGPHEAEQEKRKFLGPNSVGLGLGYFKRAKLSHSCN